MFKKFHAKGGMGEVWLAEDSDIGRPVALKRMLKGREKQRLQFVKEARVTGQLEHPGVIPVHELSLDENDQPYYVMKFVHGQTLKEVIEDYHSGKNDVATPREVQWLRLLNIFLDLCQTIAYAHSRGVIHRDIKPDNVMVGAYGETLVLDWGLAKVIGEPESSDPMATIQLSGADTMASLAGTIKGTPTFFAPEVAAGKVSEVDQISDVYLLGATLYNMIVGKPPREGKKISQLLEDARTKAPIPPRQLDPTVPKPLNAICTKAIAHQKADRYPSASAMAEDVQRYLAGEPVSAYEENLLERTWRWIKRHRTALGRTAAALVLCAVAATAFVFIRDAEIRRREAQATADNLRRQDDARKEIISFRKALEEARFYAASADPVAEHAPMLDTANAETKAKEAFAIAEAWGPNLEEMPLEDQRPTLKKDLYDLLLEVAQLKSRDSSEEAAKNVQAILARAAALQEPTQSYYRLRARSFDVLKKPDEAAADQKRASDSRTPTTSMDHYLAGEQSRVESRNQVKVDVADGKQAGIAALLARRDLLNKAIESYRLALRDDPNHYWSHFQLGACYSGLGAYAEAAGALGACIALRPDAPWGYSTRGLALAQLPDRSADAEADLNFALKIDPDFQPARLHRAAYYAARKKYEQAEADFEAVLVEKHLPEAIFARGQMYMDRLMFDEALADFNEVVAAKLPIRTVYLHLARIYLVKEEPDKALENLTLYSARTKEFDKDSASAHEQRGRELRLLAGEFPADARNRREAVYLLAVAQFEKAIKLRGETATLYGDLGAVEEKLAELQPKQGLKRMQQAIKAYSRAIELAPKDAKLREIRGWAYSNLAENGKAKDDFAAAVALDPTYAMAYTGLGYTEAMLKVPVPARRHAGLAVLHGSGDYVVLHNVACIYGALSSTDPTRSQEYQEMAIDQLQQAVDLWKKGNRMGPSEIQLIEVESAFPPALRERPEFKKLLKDNP